MTGQVQRWLATDVRTECTVSSADPDHFDDGSWKSPRDIDQRRFPEGVSERAELRRLLHSAQPLRHTLAHKMSFLRVAFRGPAASFARNRVPISAAVIPRRTWLPQRAAFSAVAGLTKEEITTRVFDVLKGFEKVDPTKVHNNKFNALLQGV